jgi:hypothetical protein
VGHLTFGVHHEYQNFEMVKLFADAASNRAGMDKRCLTMQNLCRLLNASSKMWRH